jgi:hypothetical protein
MMLATLALVLALGFFSGAANAETCSSDRDYELGQKHGLKMAPRCNEAAAASNAPPRTGSSRKATNNFLIGLCSYSNPEWSKLNCDPNLVTKSDVWAVVFWKFEDDYVVAEYVSGGKCFSQAGVSADRVCINKSTTAIATYDFQNDGSIIQNTHAGGCVIPNKYSMKNGLLYVEYGGEARGSCLDEQVQSAQMRKKNGKERVYYVRK